MNKAFDLILKTYAHAVNCRDCPWCRVCSVPYDDVKCDKETEDGCALVLKKYVIKEEAKKYT